MDFSLNEEQRLFQNSIRQFLESKGGLALPRQYMNGEKNVLENIWSGLSELGYFGITVSEKYGGLGLGPLTLVPILEELGRVIVPGPYLETMAFTVPLLEKYGTQEQKEKYLPQLAAGKKKATLAVLEGDGTLSAEQIRLRAIRKDESFLLEGSKILVPHGDIADLMIVAARTGGANSEYGISLFLVECDASQLDKKELISIDETRTLFGVGFNEVKVSTENIIGPIDGGYPLLQMGLNHLLAGWCSSMVGGIEGVVHMATEYANTRQQFGQPIGRFQAIKHKIVEMKLDLERARSLSYYASWALENETDDMLEAIASASAFIKEAYIRASSNNIQVHGGMGFTWEFDCHLFLKRARSLENYLGSPEDYREIAARELGW